MVSRFLLTVIFSDRDVWDVLKGPRVVGTMVPVLGGLGVSVGPCQWQGPKDCPWAGRIYQAFTMDHGMSHGVRGHFGTF
jgi:hypothetical protein